MSERYKDAIAAKLHVEEILALQRELWELKQISPLANKPDESTIPLAITNSSVEANVISDTALVPTDIVLIEETIEDTPCVLDDPEPSCVLDAPEPSHALNDPEPYNKQFCLQYLRTRKCGKESCQKRHAMVCRNFQKNGRCKYADKCSYYHPLVACKFENCKKLLECPFKHEVVRNNKFLSTAPFLEEIIRKLRPPPPRFRSSMQMQTELSRNRIA